MICANATITGIMATSLSSVSGSCSWPGVVFGLLEVVGLCADRRVPLVLEEGLGSSRGLSCCLGGQKSSTFRCFG